MDRSVRRALPAAVAVFLLLAGSARAQDYRVRGLGPPVVTGPLSITPILFQEREIEPLDRVEAEEGVLRVPLRHGEVGPDSIEIHFVRFRSTSETPGPPIVYLAGGPGGSGSWSSSGDRFDLFQRLRAMGDVIALDQRGTFRTTPYTVCPGAWSYPLDRAADGQALREALRPFLEECFAFWSGSTDLRAFTTWQNAEDLDDLRAALGADRIVLWGISYGTHLALAYIRQHPDRVAAALLHGTEGPDHTYKLPANVDRILLRVDSAMKADPRLSRVMPDFLGSLRETLARLEREPARVQVRHPETRERVTVVIGADDVRRGVFGALGESEDIAELPERAAPVFRGDYSDVAEEVASGRTGNRSLAMSYAMDCASGVSPARRALIDEQVRTATIGGVANMSIEAECAVWPHDDLGEEFRGPVRGDMPVLFVSGSLDARTPPSNAEEVRAGFPNSHHVIIEGGSHDDDLVIVSPEIGRVMLAFLRGERNLPDRITLPPIEFRRP